jgi:hypothetical protein
MRDMDETPEPLERATQLVKTGHLTEAKNTLLQYLRQNPTSEQAWLLMSYTVSDVAQQKDCLERVLKINPENAMARSKLGILTGAASPSAPTPASPPTPTRTPPAMASVSPAREEPPSPIEPPKPSYSAPSSEPSSLLSKLTAPSEPILPLEDSDGNTIFSMSPAPDKGRLSRLRTRTQSENAPEPISGSQLFSSNESTPEEPKPTPSYPVMHTPVEQDFSPERKPIPLLGILAALVVIILVVVFFLSGGSNLLLPSATPTPLPTDTPIVVSLPPVWTETPTPTATVTPTVTLTPTPTLTVTNTPAVSHTPTARK